MAEIRSLDLDSFFDPTWTPDYGNRVFFFDAFLSHNRADSSPSLKSRLEASGLRIWHDADADLRARKVRVRVAAGLKSSRFVVVCIHDGFLDSLWCRAEYLPALDIEKRTQVQRVLVAQMSASIVVPSPLQGAPAFDCTHEIPPAMLDLLTTGNRLAFDPGPVLQAACSLPVSPTEALKAVIEEACEWEWAKDEFGSDPERDAKIMTARLAISYLRKTAGDELDLTGQRIQAYRSILSRVPAATAQQWPSELRQAICDFAALIACSTDRDDRANALYILEWLAAAGSRPEDLAAISEVLRTDTDPIVLGEGLKAYAHLRVGAGEISQAVLELAFLRGSSRLGADSTSYFAGSISEAVRLRCALKGDLIDESFLTASEQLLLIEERVNFVLSESVYLDLEGVADQVRIPLQISDLELELRQLRHVMRLFAGLPQQEATQLYQRVVSLIGSVAATSEERQGQPLLAMAEWVLEYALYPLLRSMLNTPATREAAVETYRRVCFVMEASGKFGHEVPVYLAGLEAALATNDFGQAQDKIERGLLDAM